MPSSSSSTTLRSSTDAPTTFEALQTWVHENPGTFTYPAIPDFVGSVFIRHLFYWAAGGPDPFLGEFDQAVFDQYAPVVWEYLNDIEPDLWRGGDTYPRVQRWRISWQTRRSTST